MYEKIKEKAKGIWENHGGTILLTGSLFGAYLLGTKVGDTMATYKIECGIQQFFKIKPEAEALFREYVQN